MAGRSSPNRGGQRRLIHRRTLGEIHRLPDAPQPAGKMQVGKEEDRCCDKDPQQPQGGQPGKRTAGRALEPGRWPASATYPIKRDRRAAEQCHRAQQTQGGRQPECIGPAGVQPTVEEGPQGQGGRQQKRRGEKPVKHGAPPPVPLVPTDGSALGSAAATTPCAPAGC